MKRILLLSFALITLISFGAMAQNTVSGKVVDDTGESLPGVNVLIKGTTTGTQTDLDGNYSLSVEDGATLVFSYVGFETQEIEVGARTTIDVTLGGATELQEVVVTGYTGTIREDLSSSIKTVDSERIQDFNPSLSVDNMLQGQAAGVSVTGANGQPGSRAFVQIRGVSSIQGGRDPLYIVDGVPLDATNVNNINPNDIESISVLKDAASSALYGSRAGNGVIVITTKKGSSGDAQITFRSSIGFGERIPDNYDLMNTADRFRYESELADLGVVAAAGTPGGGGFSPAQTEVFRAIDTNWEDEILRTAKIQNYSLGISGGNEQMSYFLSLAYDENDGIVDNLDGFNRYSARVNTSYQAKDWLRVQSNLSISRSESFLPRDRNNVQNPIRAFYDYLPYASVFQQNADGSLILDGSGQPIYNQGLGTGGYNVIEALITNPETNVNLVTIGNVSAEAKFLKKFTNRLTVGVSNDRFTRTSFLQPGNRLDFFVGDANNPGSKTDGGSNDFRWVLTNVLSYNTTIGDKHNIGANALIEYNKRNFSNYSLTSIGFPTTRLDRQAIAAQPTAATTNGNSNALLSYGGFVDYNYDSKYLFSASLRTDGSSRFGPENRWGLFWSVSAGWNIANESFFNVDFVSSLKVRASYGVTGNQQIGDFNALERIDFNSRNGASTALPDGVADRELGWEEQQLIDIGVDFTMFDARLNGTIDYFQRTSSDLLNTLPLSRTAGDENNSLLTNIGEIQSKGFEFELSYDIIRRNDLKVSVGGNAYWLDTEVKSLPGGQDIFRGFDLLLREGQEINTFFLVRYAGVNPSNGEPLYLTADGEVTNEFNPDDAVALDGQSPQARWEGGFFASVFYKGIDFRADAVFREGNYIYNTMYARSVNDGSNLGANQSRDAFNYWKQPGDTDVLPNPIYFQEANQTSDRFLQNGSFIRLRNVILGYTLPQSLSQKAGLESVRIFVQGQNLLTFRPNYDGDPEIGIASDESVAPTDNFNFVSGERSLFSYPQTRSYTAGLEIRF